MALKSVFNTMKQEGYLIKPIDQYLLSLNARDNDRASNVNSPSQAGVCQRANYYARMGYQQDGSIEPRTRRIFNNGDGVHDRLQGYLEQAGVCLMREVPVLCDPYTIQGHTDGLVRISKEEIGILEIKSINSNGFTNLKEPKPEHKLQAMVYLYCCEERRKYLRSTYKTEEEFKASKIFRVQYYTKHYQHFKDGSKYTRKEKIRMQVKLGLQADELLWNTPRPITKVVFLYECKDNQDLKEYTVTRDNEVLDYILNRYAELNEAIANEQIPEREGTSKSCPTCRWCNYRLECFC